MSASIGAPPDAVFGLWRQPFAVGPAGLYVFDANWHMVGDDPLPRSDGTGFRARGHGRVACKMNMPDAFNAWVEYARPLRGLELNDAANALTRAWRRKGAEP